MLGQIVFDINLTLKHFCKPKYQPKINNIWAIVSHEIRPRKGAQEAQQDLF